jgi:WD40 repeat protein
MLKESSKFKRLKVYDPENGIMLHNSWEGEFLDKFPELLCQICLCLVLDPLSCQNCDSIYCSKCIKQYSRYSGLCPNRCRLVLKPVNRIVKNMINQIKIKCIFFFKGCKEILNHEKFENHINTCEFGPYLCLAKNCYSVDILSKMTSHTKFCEYFNMLKNFGSRVFAEKNQSKLKTICPYCKDNFQENTILVHSFLCERQSVVCKTCDVRMSLREYRNHDLNNSCLLNQYENRIANLQEKLNTNEHLITVLQNELLEAEQTMKESVCNHNHENEIASNKSQSLKNVISVEKELLERPNKFNSFKNLKIVSCPLMVNSVKLDEIEIKENILIDLKNEKKKIEDKVEELKIEIRNIKSNGTTVIFKHPRKHAFPLFYHSKTLDPTSLIVSCKANESQLMTLNFQNNELQMDTIDLEVFNLSCGIIFKPSLHESSFSSSSSTKEIILGTKEGHIFFYSYPGMKLIRKSLNLCNFAISHIQILEIPSNMNSSSQLFNNRIKRNHSILIIAGNSHLIKLFNKDFLNYIGQIDVKVKQVLNLCLLDNKYLIASCKDNSLRVWDINIEEGDEKNIIDPICHHFRSHTDLIWTIATCTILNKDIIFSGSGDKTIKLWTLEQNQWNNALTLYGHKDSVTALHFKEVFGNNLLFSGSYDGTIRIWKLNSLLNKALSLEFSTTYDVHNDKINFIFPILKFSDNFSFELVSVSDDEEVKKTELKIIQQ